MTKQLVALALTLLVASQACAQFTGPKTGKTGQLVKITFKAKEFKLKCTPENPDWEAAKPILANDTYSDDDSVTIYFVPQKEATYTFILASVPLALETHEIVIGKGTPTPPTPPKPDDVKAALQAAYLTSPNASDAQKLLGALKKWATALDSNQYTIDSNAAKADLKKLTIDSGIEPTALRPFRDEVTKFLTATPTADRRAVLTKAIEVLSDVVSAQQMPKAQSYPPQKVQDNG